MKRKELMLIVLLLSAGMIASQCGTPSASGITPSAPPKSPLVTSEVAMSPQWSEVADFIEKQQFEQAYNVVKDILAEGKKDSKEHVLALVKLTQLRIALHGYETAVKDLKAAEWPKDQVAKAVLNLFYAQALRQYASQYAWEIRQRERIASSEELDLKTWTQSQIQDAIVAAYNEVWVDREAYGGIKKDALPEYLDANDYPAGIRPTLRDAISYLYASLLANSAYWSATESNEAYLLNVNDLLTPAEGSPEKHPLQRISRILTDLEAWHKSQGNVGAALEARLELCRLLSKHFTVAQDALAIRTNLENTLKEAESDSWWAEGMAVLAELTMLDESWDSLNKARQIALKGIEAFPHSQGARHCKSIVGQIEQPDYSTNSMESDALNRRSIEVLSKNLDKLYFRAYFLKDPLKYIQGSDSNVIFPEGDKLDKFIARRKPDVEWSVDLARFEDFRQHRTWVTPPLEKQGLWLIVSSGNADFTRADNLLRATPLLLTDIVFSYTQQDSKVEVTTMSGSTGEPIAGADITLFRNDWGEKRKVHAKVRSDKYGRATFDTDFKAPMWLLVVEKGDQIAFNTRSFWTERSRERSVDNSSFIYTDRSVYRPGQTVKFKVVAYGAKKAGESYVTLADERIWVSLRDTNNETVETVQMITNAYGTASGEFVIPSGRALGGWRIVSSFSGDARVLVEEYKRPTFEASFIDPAGALRLNHKATIKGEARYYFGMPVGVGTVAWKVRKTAIYPFWWYWWGITRAEPQVVAAGNSKLAEDGSFEIEFLPLADERTADHGTTWRFEVTADVTDEGGETRSVTKVFNLGFKAVTASIGLDREFYTPTVSPVVEISRQDLNGLPAPGDGEWEIYELLLPDKVTLPADRPIAARPDADPKAPVSPGDSLPPRWEARYDTGLWLSDWKEGTKFAEGKVSHGESGLASIDMPTLKAGAWRIKYSTVDAFGGKFKTSKDFIVSGKKLPLPFVAMVDKSTVKVGDTARLLVDSGIDNQSVTIDVYSNNKLQSSKVVTLKKQPQVISFPIAEKDRGGFVVRVSALSDHQVMQRDISVFVPWDNKQLKLHMTAFRDLMRPKAVEKWSVKVTDASLKQAPISAAEVLAYMYDRSLDIFETHRPPDPIGVYIDKTKAPTTSFSLGETIILWLESEGFERPAYYFGYTPDALVMFDSFGIGGPGNRRLIISAFRATRFSGAGGLVRRSAVRESAPAAPAAMAPPEDMQVMAKGVALEEDLGEAEEANAEAPAQAQEEVSLRTDFSETAFWEPHLITDREGNATFEFTVPDSVTSWNLWVHAITKNLMSGSLKEQAQSVKDLMVRPYLPRFLREGDTAELKVVVNNTSDHDLKGEVSLDLLDPETEASLASEFGLDKKKRKFEAKAQGSATLMFPIVVPDRVGTVAFKAVATSGDFSDGELRPIPVLPGRIHLAQSRFVTLKDNDQRTMKFEDLAKNDDSTLINEQMVVTVDSQLFFQVLSALPYLVNHPYECVDNILNRFVSTGILTSLYKDFPAVAEMAKKLGERKTRFESWDNDDPNRRMALEETPWLRQARGEDGLDWDLINVLDPTIALAQRTAALAKLQKAQLSSGGFPWFPGGPASPYITLYVLYSFSKAMEFGVDVPKPMVQKAWQYLNRYYLNEIVPLMAKHDCCWHFITLLGYVISNFPDDSWTKHVFDSETRKTMLNYSFKHWKKHSPYIKGLLALTLNRAGRQDDAKLVWDSVMDSAKTVQDQGTFWAPEDRSWLWYNDTIESHAFALRTLLELEPKNEKLDGLVLWLFLNKKLNHWKSTRATAEVIYSLAHYLKQTGGIASREVIDVKAGEFGQQFVFEPTEYTGKNNQLVIPGEKIDPKTTSTITVSKEGKGHAFASATWHFSTKKLPKEARGDFLEVTRSYFKRTVDGDHMTLIPLKDKDKLEIGDEIEVHLSIRSKHAMEYVHVRDPRGAGFEPVDQRSKYHWNLGIAWYQEIRDNGTNFFFENLPVGEYPLKYRVRATTAGTWQLAPATIQPMYAPEFVAYSAGNVLEIKAK